MASGRGSVLVLSADENGCRIRCGGCGHDGVGLMRDRPLSRAMTAFLKSGSEPRAYLGRSVFPIRNVSIDRAHSRPSRMAQTTSDWPRRMSPAVNTFGREV
jgi:hypothetical protein